METGFSWKGKVESQMEGAVGDIPVDVLTKALPQVVVDGGGVKVPHCPSC